MWQIIHCESWLDKLSDTAPNRHICKGVYYGISILIPYRVKIWWNTYMEQRQIRGQKSFKNYTKCIITHLVSLIGLYEACNLCIDSLYNTHPLKVDRNLQWMSHHPTNPTYNPVLSGTMTHSSAQCLNSTTKTHNTNTFTQKVCIRYLMYCMPTLWKCDYSTCGPKCNRPPN